MVYRACGYSIIASVFIIYVSATQNLFDEDLYNRVLNNVTCKTHLHKMSFSQFFDASGRIPQSVTLGSQGSLGNYHQCLGIAQQIPNDTISGKYCMIQVPLQVPDFGLNGTWFELINITDHDSRALKNSQQLQFALHAITGNTNIRTIPTIPNGLSVHLPLCIPKTCTTHDAIGMFTDLLNVQYKDQYCRLLNDKIFSAVDYVAVAVIVVLGILTTLSTGYDLYHIFVLQKDSAQISKVLTCCSIYTNTRRLLTFSKAPSSIDCLDGVRALSILWVVIGHSFSNTLLNTVVNMLTVYEWIMSADSIWILSAVLSVDTFFMMSGLLAVYTIAGKLSPMSLLKSLHLLYAHRFLRMFPLLAAAVLFQASLAHHSGDGPAWPALAPAVQQCRDWWWAALLHVQNYVNPDEMCLVHSWYLSVDAQLHVLAPLVVVAVLRARRAAWAALAAALLASLVAATVYCFVRDIGFILHMGSNMSSIIEYFRIYYVNTLTRAPAFVVGMLVGYVLYDWREHPRPINKWMILGGWLAALALAGGVVWSVSPGAALSGPAQRLLNGLMRPLWALGVGWLVFACAAGYGGPINWFLSLTVWKFVARVSYALYLIHYPLQGIVRLHGEVPVIFSVTSTVYVFYTDISLSLMIATALCIIVDAPFSTLQKILIGGKANLSSPPPPQPSGSRLTESVDEIAE